MSKTQINIKPAQKGADRVEIERLLSNAGPGGLTREELAERVGITLVRAKTICADIISNGNAVGQGPKGEGRRIVWVQSLSKQKAPKPQPVRNGTNTERGWVPPELKSFEGRPDAMDAFKLPSMVNGVRVPYTPPKPVCTGAAGPILSMHNQLRFDK